MSIILSKCAECKHFLPDTNNTGGLKCEAFPEGIPLEIFKSDESVKCSKLISYEKEED